MIADALGLSFVHVSRVLGTLTSEGLISRNGGVIEIKDQAKLVESCDFYDDYLHLDASPPPYWLRTRPLDSAR